MVRFLTEAETQATLPQCISHLRVRAKRKNQLDIELMRNVCREIINERRQTSLGSKNDLLDTMLNSQDGLSGEALSDDSVIDNILTFLIAGHETTSGLLSFAMYYLMKNPDAMARATHEVDEVVGDHQLTVEHLAKLKYINAVLRETLRLMPTAPGFSVTPYKPEVIGGKYRVKPGDSLDIFLAAVHRDPAVYSGDVDEFQPERMFDDAFQKLPANAWKPFGNGKRSCIGRAFAWQEALMILALVLQNFTFNLTDKDYALKLKESLTIKPNNLWAYAKPRPGRSVLGTQLLHKTEEIHVDKDFSSKEVTLKSKPATILYGSNSGTCEALAHRLAVEMNRRCSFTCSVKPMNEFADRQLPRGQPLIILTGSYDGRPPENARHYMKWLQTLQGKKLEGIQYAVFGCGHRDWASTFHKIPILVDEKMSEHGGSRIALRGSVDTAEEDPFAGLESWSETILWPGLEASFDLLRHDLSDTLDDRARITIGPPYALRAAYETAIVREVRTLTSQGTTAKIHVELDLPDTIEYQAGDHLAILPMNPPQNVQRVLSLFHIGPDSLLYITSSSAPSLPTDTPISAYDLLSGYVELNQVVTPGNLKTLAAKAADEKTSHHLTALATEQYITEIWGKELSLLEILEIWSIPSLRIGDYLQMLPPLRPRQYTISSSSQLSPRRASLTVSVVGQGCGRNPTSHNGVTSNYLMGSVPGSIVRVSLRHPNSDFRLPGESVSQPIIMVSSGSGIAPFRAFIQERSLRQKEKPHAVALPPAVLFFGCRGAHLDNLYCEELDDYERHGVVTIFRAYSRIQSGHHGCKYVQDLVWKERELVKRLWQQDAKIFVCGSLKMNEGVKKTMAQILPAIHTEEFTRRYLAEVFT